MHAYVFTKNNVFVGVCTKEQVVVIWAQYNDETICMKYDDVGVCEGEVDLKKTAEMKRVMMAHSDVTA